MIASWHCIGGGPQEGARQCWERGQLVPPHLPQPGHLDAGGNPTTINLTSPEGQRRLQRYRPLGAAMEGS